jgi:hypothetical protein
MSSGRWSSGFPNDAIAAQPLWPGTTLVGFVWLVWAGRFTYRRLKVRCQVCKVQSTSISRITFLI